jgi:hypothetical protein
MGTIKNQSDGLDKNFENHNYLPQKLLLEDIDLGLVNYIKDQGISMINEKQENRRVPVIWATQELWAERKQNFQFMENENGEEIGRPFIAIYKTGVKEGTSPLKYSIPAFNRSQLASGVHKFKFVKVPVFDGTLKGYTLWKVPQPVYVDVEYEMIFETRYQTQVNQFIEMLNIEAFPARQGYMRINGYSIPSMMEDPSEESTFGDISSEQVFQITVPLKVYGKLVDPSKFEEVQTINKISINICEKKD